MTISMKINIPTGGSDVFAFNKSDFTGIFALKANQSRNRAVFCSKISNRMSRKGAW
jgi:hypothetical protein